MQDLTGKVAIVTGASSGIGRATAQVLSSRGASVLLFAIDDAVHDAAAAVAREGGDAWACQGDVGKGADWERAVRQVEERHGRLDCLFNNAGIGVKKPVTELSESEFVEVLRVNLVGTFLGCKAAIPLMIRSGGGAIVNNASTHGMLGFPEEPDYAASKGGIIALTRQIAVDYAPFGVRVNAISPGPTLTDRIANRLHIPGRREEQLSAVPLGRYAKPEEIGAAVAFLFSDDAAYITGIVLPVDGGQTSSRRLRKV